MRKLLKPINEADILRVFHTEKTPLHSMVRLSEYSLTWLIAQLFNNQQGKPLRLLPFQSVMLWMLWNKKFPMILAARGGSKTFMLALYALVRAILCPGSEIIIVGSGLRQSMKVFGYIVKLYNQSPLIQEAIKKFDRSIGIAHSGPRIVMTGPYMKVGNSTITALPIGDGEKIRGQRATQILVDEFASINESIFETVIRPFAAVHVNPEERVYVEGFCNRLKKLGANDDMIDQILSLQGYGNQIVLTGTASYEFNHFFKHYQSYKMIAASKGDPELIKKAMEVRARISGDHFSRMSKDEIGILAKGWQNYAVLRMPYAQIPVGFLDAEVVANDKATFTAVRFGLEYECEFAKDSDGFIKRSIIEDATPKEDGAFSIELYGEPGREYVLGLDPAKFNDNFGLVVLKLTPTGMQPVYADAWIGKDTPESVQKIRDIMRRFNIVRIAIDQGGGGEAVAETLRDPKHCEPGELPIYPLREQIQDKKMLGADALFILDVVKWSSSWIALNAPALEGDIHHHRLLFPIHPIIEDLYGQYERRVLNNKRKINDDEKKIINEMTFGKETEDFDIIELGAWDNLQAMIDETCAIERVVTPGGVEKFELPSLGDQPEGMDIRRRDRFSALVLASYAARVYKDIGRNQKAVIPGGSPEALLRLGRGRRARINKKGSVMY